MIKKLTFRIDTWVTVSEESDLEREGAVALVPMSDERPVLEAVGEGLSGETCVKPRPIAAAAASPNRAPIRIMDGMMRTVGGAVVQPAAGVCGWGAGDKNHPASLPARNWLVMIP
ncbi:MAG TPA: hypothetical protein VF962_03495 [Gemmatimonadaceae bacterium]